MFIIFGRIFILIIFSFWELIEDRELLVMLIILGDLLVFWFIIIRFLFFVFIFCFFFIVLFELFFDLFGFVILLVINVFFIFKDCIFEIFVCFLVVLRKLNLGRFLFFLLIELL